jgi:hypothetical protein
MGVLIGESITANRDRPSALAPPKRCLEAENHCGILQRLGGGHAIYREGDESPTYVSSEPRR